MPQKIDEHSAATKFRLVRKSEKLTQEQMAKKLGKDQPVIARYESGKTDVPAEIVLKLNELFGVSFDWWYRTIEPMKVINSEKAALTSQLLDLRNTIELQEQRFKNLLSNKEHEAQILKIMEMRIKALEQQVEALIQWNEDLRKEVCNYKKIKV